MSIKEILTVGSDGQATAGGSGLNEQPLKNYMKTYANANSALTIAGTIITATGNLISLTSAHVSNLGTTITSSASTTLRGDNNYLTSMADTSTTGAAFFQLPAFTLEGSDYGKPVYISFDVNGVAADGNWDVVIARYTSAGVYGSLISVAGNASGSTPASAKLPTGTTTFNGFFVPDSTTPTDLYAIRLRHRVSNAAIRIDTLFIGPQPIRVGAAITDWQSYTPSGPYTTNTTYTGRWRRVSDSIELRIDLAFTGVPGGSSLHIFTFSQLLNGLGLTVDTSKFPNTSDSPLQLGSWAVLDTGSNVFNGGIGLDTASQVSLYKAAGGIANGTTPVAVDNGDNLCLSISFPITGWSSNVTMADRAVEEYASNSSSSTTVDDSSSFTYGPSGNQIRAVTVGLKRRVRFTTPIQPTDKMEVEVSSDQIKWFTVSNPINGNYQHSSFIGSNSYGLGRIDIVNATDVDVHFGAYAYYGTTWNGAGTSWSSASGYYWRVRKVSGGAQVGYPISSANIVGRVDGVAPATGMVAEQLSQSRVAASALALTTTTQTNVTATALTLTPGVWDISGFVGVIGSATSCTQIIGSVSTTSATLGSQDNAYFIDGATRNLSTSDYAASLPVYRVNITSSTIYYLVTRVIFSGGGNTAYAYGRIQAIRIA